MIIRFRTGVALAPFENPADTSPRWNMLFPIGRFFRSDFPKGGIDFNPKMLGEMVANWEALGRPPKQVNYFHRGESVADGVPNEDKVAAGWVEALELRADGLWGLIKWTEKARLHILADELRYLSPEFSLTGTNKLTGKPQGATFYGVALLNDPFLETMPKVAASEAPSSTPEHRMNPKILLALGLSETADEATALDAISKLKDATTSQVTEVKSLSDAKVSLSEQVTKLTEQVGALTTEKEAAVKKLADFEQAQKTAEAKAFVAGLVKDGKLAPAQVPHAEKVALSDLALAKDLFGAAKPVVDLSEKGVSSGNVAGDKVAAQARLDERVKALRDADGNLSTQAAYSIALAEMPDVNTTLFGESPKSTRA